MKKLLSLLAIGAVATCINAAPINVTVQDPYSPHLLGTGPGGEIGEVEIGIQAYDLHSVLWDKVEKELSFTGAYNFKTVPPGFELGDIFIDLNKDNSYDLAYKLDVANETYSVYEITNTKVLEYGSSDHGLVKGLYSNNIINNNPALSPIVWQYNINSGQEAIDGGTFSYNSTSPNSISGFKVTSNSFNVSLTMRCANDVIHGSVSEPFTFTLLGIGLLGVVVFNRRKRI